MEMGVTGRGGGNGEGEAEGGEWGDKEDVTGGGFHRWI